MNGRILFTQLVAVALAPAATAQICARQLGAFPAQQRVAVRAAAREGHLIRRFAGEVNGQRRVVTVVGESLLKSPAVARAGTGLARAFDVVAYGGTDFTLASWFPKIFAAHRDRRLEAERAAAPTKSLGSLIGALPADDKVRAFEDEVVRTLVDKVRTGRMTRGQAHRIALDTKLGGGHFDARDVARRVLAGEVTRRPQRRLNLEDGYAPTTAHNLAMLVVVVSDKLGPISGRVARIASALAALGGFGWMIVTNGQDGGGLALSAAATWAAQTALHFGRVHMAPEFGGASARSRYVAPKLRELLAATSTADEILYVGSEAQAIYLARDLAELGFSEEVHLPRREGGRATRLVR